MQQLWENNEQALCLEDSIQELESINKKLAKLLVKKEALTEKVIGAIGHDKEGQKTYEYQAWKIEVKTPCVYSLDKKMYESGRFEIPKKFNPIKKSVSYAIDKRLCEKYITEAPPEVRDMLVELIEKRPGKASITIKERV